MRSIFRFHDVAVVETESDSPFAQSFFEAEYGHHRVDGPPAPDLPRARLTFRMASEAPRGFTRHTHKILAHWAYRVALAPAQIDLQVNGNAYAVPMAHHMLVHPSLRFLSATHGTLLLHAGAVVCQGRSLIFTGKGGAGKTTTTSLVLSSGDEWQLHADDYVFLQPGARSLAYITRSHLYLSLLDWVPELSSRLTGAERFRLAFFGHLRAWSGERVKWPVRLAPQRLWPGRPIADSAVPAALLLLERGASAALTPVDDRSAVADELLDMNFGEARHFLKLLSKAGALDAAWLESWKQAEKALLENLLADIPVYRLVLPNTKSAGDVRAALLPSLKKLVG